jgi:hypothetical protein
MATQGSNGDAQTTDAPQQPVPATTPAQEKGPYDELLCTICNLKACWMTPEAAGKSSPGEQAQTTG